MPPEPHICTCGDCEITFVGECRFELEVEVWKEHCRNLVAPNPGGWREALEKAKKALASSS